MWLQESDICCGSTHCQSEGNFFFSCSSTVNAFKGEIKHIIVFKYSIFIVLVFFSNGLKQLLALKAKFGILQQQGMVFGCLCGLILFCVCFMPRQDNLYRSWNWSHLYKECWVRACLYTIFIFVVCKEVCATLMSLSSDGTHLDS